MTSPESALARAERFEALQRQRAAALEAQLDRLVELAGTERALDVGTGTGALAYALASRVREVVALDADAAMAERARVGAPPNVEVMVADGEALPFADATFDLAATLRTLHHTAGPERLVAELVRVTRPGGTLLVVDQLAPDDDAAARALGRFERARDASTTRLLGETELRALFRHHGLAVRREEIVHEHRELDAYLDLAGCVGEARERAAELAPAGYEAALGWFLLDRA